MWPCCSLAVCHIAVILTLGLPSLWRERNLIYAIPQRLLIEYRVMERSPGRAGTEPWRLAGSVKEQQLTGVSESLLLFHVFSLLDSSITQQKSPKFLSNKGLKREVSEGSFEPRKYYMSLWNRVEIDSNYIIKRKIITRIQYIFCFCPPAIPFAIDKKSWQILNWYKSKSKGKKKCNLVWEKIPKWD